VRTVRRALADTRDAQAAADALVDRALKLNTRDNATAVVCCLHSRPIALPRGNSMLFRRGAATALGSLGGGPPG
jgi:hypothetical protein